MVGCIGKDDAAVTAAGAKGVEDGGGVVGRVGAAGVDEARLAGGGRGQGRQGEDQSPGRHGGPVHHGQTLGVCEMD